MGLEINRRVFLSTGAAGPLALTRLSPQQPSLDVGNRAQLLLDDHLVERKRGLRLRVTPARADHIRLVSPDSPADRNGVWAWVSVAQEGERVRMWYNGCALGDPREVSRLCYAESDDGAHWDKPACGVTSFQGSKKNNIVLTIQDAGGVFLDPAAAPGERYKCVFGERDKQRGYGYRMTFRDRGRVHDWLGPTIEGASSPDGIHWTKGPGPLMDWYTDACNVCYYDPRLRKYVCFVRDNQYPRFKGGAIRCISRTESETFGDFPQPQRVLAPDELDPLGMDLYNSAAQPYPFAEGIYLLFPAAYYHDTDNLEVQLATSRDSIRWHRPDRTPFLSPGREGAFDSRMVYMGAGMISRGDEIWMYYGGFDVGHEQWERRPDLGGVGRVKFLRHRLLAQTSGSAPGHLLTKPLLFSGRRLHLNADCGAGGQVRVGVLAEDGSPIPGFRQEECEPLIGDFLRGEVRWKTGSPLSSLVGRPVRLSFRLDRHTRLYAFRFHSA